MASEAKRLREERESDTDTAENEWPPCQGCGKNGVELVFNEQLCESCCVKEQELSDQRKAGADDPMEDEDKYPRCGECGEIDKTLMGGICTNCIDQIAFPDAEAKKQATKDARNARRREARKKAKETEGNGKEEAEDTSTTKDDESAEAETDSTPEQKPKEKSDKSKKTGVDPIAEDQDQALMDADTSQETDCLELVFLGTDGKTLAKAVQGLDAKAKTRVRNAYRIYRNNNPKED